MPSTRKAVRPEEYMWADLATARQSTASISDRQQAAPYNNTSKSSKHVYRTAGAHGTRVCWYMTLVINQSAFTNLTAKLWETGDINYTVHFTMQHRLTEGQ